jgi:predicted nucleic acid-binding protein
VILLDTNVVSAVMLQRPDPEVVAWLDRINPRQVRSWPFTD